jgi:hypothetical protein
VLLETEPDTERRENVSAARFRDTESHTAGVGLTPWLYCSAVAVAVAVAKRISLQQPLEPPHPALPSSSPPAAACHGELRQRHRRLRPARQQGVAGRYCWYGNLLKRFLLSIFSPKASIFGLQPGILLGCCLKSSVLLFLRRPPLA